MTTHERDEQATMTERRLEQRRLAELGRRLRRFDPHLEARSRVHGVDDQICPPIVGVDVRLTSRASLVFFVTDGHWWSILFHAGPLGYATSPRTQLAAAADLDIDDVASRALRTILRELATLLDGGISDFPDPVRSLSDRRHASLLLQRLIVAAADR